MSPLVASSPMTESSALTALRPERSVLVVIDVQTAFRPAIDGFDRVAERCARMVRGARALEIPIVVTEQYPEGLGATVPEIADVLPPDAPRLPKTAFAAGRAPGFHLSGREQVLLVGIEAHVCVQATALDLLRQGLLVHVLTDAVGSRNAEDRAAGLGRVSAAGAVLGTTEGTLLELLGDARAPQFKTIQELIR